MTSITDQIIRDADFELEIRDLRFCIIILGFLASSDGNCKTKKKIIQIHLTIDGRLATGWKRRVGKWRWRDDVTTAGPRMPIWREFSKLVDFPAPPFFQSEMRIFAHFLPRGWASSS